MTTSKQSTNTGFSALSKSHASFQEATDSGNASATSTLSQNRQEPNTENKSPLESAAFVLLLRLLRVISGFVCGWQVVGLFPILTWFSDPSAITRNMVAMMLIKVVVMVVFGLLFFGLKKFIHSKPNQQAEKVSDESSTNYWTLGIIGVVIWIIVTWPFAPVQENKNSSQAAIQEPSQQVQAEQNTPSSTNSVEDIHVTGQGIAPQNNAIKKNKITPNTATPKLTYDAWTAPNNITSKDLNKPFPVTTNVNHEDANRSLENVVNELQLATPNEKAEKIAQARMRMPQADRAKFDRMVTDAQVLSPIDR